MDRPNDGIDMDEEGQRLVRGIAAAYHTSTGFLDRNVGTVLDALRKSGKDRDTLQDTIAKLKAKDFGIDMTFDNYRTN